MLIQRIQAAPGLPPPDNMLYNEAMWKLLRLLAGVAGRKPIEGVLGVSAPDLAPVEEIMEPDPVPVEKISRPRKEPKKDHVSWQKQRTFCKRR